MWMFYFLDMCDLLKSAGTLASRAALVSGLVPKKWESPGGLSGRWGLSIWSDGGSSLIPLSLGDGDQSGEADTESPPRRSALRKSSFGCSGGCNICWVKTSSGTIILYVWGNNIQRTPTRKWEKEDITVSHTFGSWIGQVCCSGSSWRRIPLFWSNSQSSSSRPSQPWREVMTLNSNI